MKRLKPIAVGTSAGVVIRKPATPRPNVGDGDALHAVEPPEGADGLAADDPDFVRRMDKANEIMRRYRTALGTLAK